MYFTSTDIGYRNNDIHTERTEKLYMIQRAMERTLMGINLTERRRNTKIREHTKVDDVMERETELKLRWSSITIMWTIYKQRENFMSGDEATRRIKR